MNYSTLLHIILLSIILSTYIGNAQNSTSLEKQYTNTPFPKYICENTDNNLNISILLDVSDRITYPLQKENDLQHLKHISAIFKHHIINKRLIQLEDRINLFFEPNPSLKHAHEVIEKLKFNVTKKNVSKEYIESIQKNYTIYPPKLYEWAENNPETKKGAAIWRFLKNKAASNCIKECHRNILIILTDGYLYHQGDFLKVKNRTTYINQKLLNTPALYTYDWKTYAQQKDLGILWNKEDTLNKLEILVLGINKNKHKNPNAEEIITYYWQQWFQEMGITHYAIKTADAPTYLQEIITDFVIHKK